MWAGLGARRVCCADKRHAARTRDEKLERVSEYHLVCCNGPGPYAYLLVYPLSTKCGWSVAGGGCGVVETMAALEGLEDLIREKVEQDQWSHAQLSDFLKQSYPGVQGLSIRSIQRFCQEKNIHKTSKVTGSRAG